jgi:hypothetical protein
MFAIGVAGCGGDSATLLADVPSADLATDSPDVPAVDHGTGDTEARDVTETFEIAQEVVVPDAVDDEATASDPGAETVVGCGSFVYSADATCQACAVANCCDALRACDTGTECGQVLTCLGACMSGDTTCQQACVAGASTAGKADFQTMANCVEGTDGSCTAECGSGGAICDSGLATSSNPACGDCLGASCCDSFKACVGDATCMECITGGSTTGCDTSQLLAAASSCQSQSCATECATPGTICDSGLVNSGNAACGDCVGTSCCAEFTACAQDNACLACLTGQTTAGCDADLLLKATGDCQASFCATPCQ